MDKLAKKDIYFRNSLKTHVILPNDIFIYKPN